MLIHRSLIEIFFVSNILERQICNTIFASVNLTLNRIGHFCSDLLHFDQKISRNVYHIKTEQKISLFRSTSIMHVFLFGSKVADEPFRRRPLLSFRSRHRCRFLCRMHHQLPAGSRMRIQGPCLVPAVDRRNNLRSARCQLGTWQTPSASCTGPSETCEIK